MSSARFVHLRLHSEFSITDGIVRLDDAIGRAKADGMPAMALTDLANLFGMVKFYSGMRGKGLKVELLLFEGEQHGFRRSDTLVRCLEAELAFYRDVFDVQPVPGR